MGEEAYQQSAKEDTSRPLLSFGVLTDVQYANRDDCPSWYSAEKIRYYRSSLDQIRKAFTSWSNADDHPVNFVMQLGDLFDCCNRTLDLDSDEAVRKSLQVFEEFPSIPTYHVLGNHELDNFSRHQLAEYYDLAVGRMLEFKLKPATSSNPCLDNTRNSMDAVGSLEDNRHCIDHCIPLNDVVPLAYYKFRPAPGVVIVVLDCFDISILGHNCANPNRQEALDLLSQFHTSEDKTMWDYSDHLEGMDKRFVAYNGGISREQMRWLDSELAIASANEEKVILCGHIAILPDSCKPTCIVWNYEEVLEVIHKHTCVIAYLAGHLHDNGYAVDSQGIHHVTFAGIIEVSPDSLSFSTVHLFANRIEIVGYGREKSYNLPIGSPMPVVNNDEPNDIS